MNGPEPKNETRSQSNAFRSNFRLCS